MSEVTCIVRIQIVTLKNLHLVEEEFDLDAVESYRYFSSDLETKGYSAFEVTQFRKQLELSRTMKKMAQFPWESGVYDRKAFAQLLRDIWRGKDPNE